ncbi:MAG: hypothetical protein CMJ31_02170 [Phycisphaerae bacterium]|nr:hypothetical protein [Phycisphaerae bacterium]
MFLALLKAIGPAALAVAVVTFLSTRSVALTLAALLASVALIGLAAFLFERLTRSTATNDDDEALRERVAGLDLIAAFAAIERMIDRGLIDAERSTSGWDDRPTDLAESAAAVFDRYERLVIEHLEIARFHVRRGIASHVVGVYHEDLGGVVNVDAEGRASLVYTDPSDRPESGVDDDDNALPTLAHLIAFEATRVFDDSQALV